MEKRNESAPSPNSNVFNPKCLETLPCGCPRRTRGKDDSSRGQPPAARGLKQIVPANVQADLQSWRATPARNGRTDQGGVP